MVGDVAMETKARSLSQLNNTIDRVLLDKLIKENRRINSFYNFLLIN
jgi:hypothetical protein